MPRALYSNRAWTALQNLRIRPDQGSAFSVCQLRVSNCFVPQLLLHYSTASSTIGEQLQILLKQRPHIIQQCTPTGDSKLIGNTTKLRGYLLEGSCDKVARILLETYLSGTLKLSDLLETAQVSTIDLSYFINHFLANDRLNLLEQTKTSKLINFVFELYEVYIKHASNQGKLTPIQLYDLGLFIRFFIKSGQLAKAQNVLSYVIEKQGSILECKDAGMLVLYLQLRCGALARYWKLPSTTSKGRLGEGVLESKLSSSYKAKETTSLFKILEAVLRDQTWQIMRNNSLDAAIIYSLGYLGQTESIEKYVFLTWGVVLDRQTTRPINTAGQNSLRYPNSEVLIAIITSYCYKDGNLHRALMAVDIFSKAYPMIDLDVIFWRRVFQLNDKVWQNSADPMGDIPIGYWKILRQWFKNYKHTKYVPYDYALLQCLLRIFSGTNNGRAAMITMKECMSELYWKAPGQLMEHDLKLLTKYQKFVLSWLGNKARYQMGLNFIQEWSIDAVNEHDLFKTFIKYRDRNTKVVRHKAERANQELQKKYDDAAEEDMLLGGLW